MLRLCPSLPQTQRSVLTEHRLSAAGGVASWETGVSVLPSSLAMRI